MTSKTIAIVGAGIGGLTAALAFRKAGFEATVYERAPKLGEVGAGLSVWANAMRALERLNLGERIRAISSPDVVGAICSQSGVELSVVDFTKNKATRGWLNHLMHRADLHRILSDALPPETIVTNAELVDIAQDSAGVELRFRDREPVRADYAVGADGIRSVTRAKLWGEKPVRYSGETCYRGIARLTPPEPGILREIQGRGERFGIAPLDDHRVYWFAVFLAPQDQADDPSQRREALLKRFGDWPWNARTIIEATPQDAIVHNDLVDREPIPAWSQGRITLLGDAAHPTTPNLGQGACMAIEDGFVLARLCQTNDSWDEAIAAYEAERVPRTKRIVEQSWKFGILARWRHPLAVKFRESAHRWMPKSMLIKEIDWQMGYDVGQIAGN